MANTTENRLRKFLIALLIGGTLGAVVGLVIKSRLSTSETVPAVANEPDEVDAAMPEVVRESVAWQYARAYREGDWTKIIAWTPWMEERLAFVARTEGPEAVEAERRRLIESISTRQLADNYLRSAGVDDQYIFTPGSRLAYITVDDGRDDLDHPVANRTWFRVIFPAREKALLDRDGVPIRSLAVGINVSPDGQVLKAGVTGNLDIDWESIMYDWPTA